MSHTATLWVANSNYLKNLGHAGLIPTDNIIVLFNT